MSGTSYMYIVCRWSQLIDYIIYESEFVFETREFGDIYWNKKDKK